MLLVAEHYAITPLAVTRLDTERDDSFRIRADGGDFVLKIAHPADDPAVISLQTSAMRHVSERDASVPIQTVVATVTGEFEPVVHGHDGRARIMRLLTWLPGALLRDAAPNRSQLEQLGTHYGSLTAALADFEHPSADRELDWDLVGFPRLVPLFADSPDVADAAAEVLARIGDRLERVSPGLPRQVVHNDLNPDNVVVSAVTPNFVEGILDFGDIVHTIRIADLAVALSYLLPPTVATPNSGRNASKRLADASDPAVVLRNIVPALQGYHRVNPLTPEEVAILPDLIEARLIQRILLARWFAKAVPENAEYTGRNIGRTLAQFTLLSGVGQEAASACLERSLGKLARLGQQTGAFAAIAAGLAKPAARPQKSAGKAAGRSTAQPVPKPSASARQARPGKPPRSGADADSPDGAAPSE